LTVGKTILKNDFHFWEETILKNESEKTISKFEETFLKETNLKNENKKRF
jgi:hypothetical protein